MGANFLEKLHTPRCKIRIQFAPELDQCVCARARIISLVIGRPKSNLG
jgi:hypothetical protein